MTIPAKVKYVPYSAKIVGLRADLGLSAVNLRDDK